MATIALHPPLLTVTLHGLDPLYALRRTVSVELANIRKVRANPPESHFDALVREPSRGAGLLAFGEVAVGSLMLEDGLSFYSIHDPVSPRNVIAIDLENEPFKHIVIELDEGDAEHVASTLDAMISERASHLGAL